MSSSSKIEWTDATWNPVRGCRKISPGCKFCYAETFAERFRGVPGHPYEQGFDPRLVPDKLAEPLRWSSPRTVFVNSMSDLFQEEVETAYITAVARVMQMAPWHTFQVLTKRADRMADLLSGELAFAAALPHVWWGVSVEDRKHGVPRIAHLQRAPAVTRFLSIEPLLEDVGELDLSGLHWVIVGGESGPGYRQLEKPWAVSLQAQCARAGVPFFFKQWGGYPKKRQGRELLDQVFDESPARLSHPIASRAERESLAREVDRMAVAWDVAPLVPLRRRLARPSSAQA